jgi:hypothetical protein
MSNIDPTREHPREAGISPRVEERAYTLADLLSQTLCYQFSAWQITAEFALADLLHRSRNG